MGKKLFKYYQLAGGMRMPEDVRWRRRRALEVVSQLPEDPSDALFVLELARSLIENWLIEKAPCEAAPPQVIPLRVVRAPE